MSESEFISSSSSINIEDEMKQSYMDYAMSVIVGRALPDARDGLKPVHRRVLYAMNEMGNAWNKPYKKSARVVGDVIGKYHPHGDTAIYDTIVRMAQPFSLRYVLIDGQGNFGSVDGDSPAAMRYTEVRMAQIAHELLKDIDKKTVDFAANYDGSEQEPSVLPTQIPNLLVNGSSGIAVGMATNIPPHNLTEVLNACIHLIEHPDASIEQLIKLVPGPDFPTFGIINGTSGIQEAYRTGRGKIYIRARCHIENNGDESRAAIIVTELPYQVNKARLLEKIAELVKEKRLVGIRELRDESDKDGMRVVIELRRNEVPEITLNNLYKFTRLQTVFGINMVALDDGQPKLMGLKKLLEAFLRHRREVVTRRTLFELRKARARAHLLEGLTVAFANIDPVIALIKKAAGPAEARQALLDTAWDPGMVVDMLKKTGADRSRPEDLASQYGLDDQKYYLSPMQAQAILDLRLHKLTSIEQSKLLQEFDQLLDTIAALLKILSSPEQLSSVIKEELAELKTRYDSPRHTTITAQHQDLSTEDLITEQEMVVTLSHKGYAKSQPIDTYRSQRRGGKGKKAAMVKDDDFIDQLFIASTHDTILCFSSLGKVYWLKVYALPQANRTARGQPIVNVLSLVKGERISAILPIRTFNEDKYVFMATNNGVVKKTALIDFSRPRPSGIRAIELAADDKLIGAALTNGQKDVMLFSDAGKVIRFNESQMRPVGRTAKGVIGIRLAKGKRVISLIIIEKYGAILTATTNGYGKRTPITDYRTQNRGGIGVISIQTSARNGPVVGAVLVQEEDEIMLISDQGKMIRSPVRDISMVGRNTQGVRLVHLDKKEQLAGVAPIIEEEEKDKTEES